MGTYGYESLPALADMLFESNTSTLYRVSKLIQHTRMNLSMTQGELARKLRVRVSEIKRYEDMVEAPSLLFLEKMARALGASLVMPRFHFKKEPGRFKVK